MESLAGLSVVIVVLVGGFQVIDGTLTWPSLLAFVMAVRVMHTPLHLIHKQYVEIQTWHASVWRIVEFLATKPQICERDDAQQLRSAPQTISCHGLGFAYDETQVLHDLSFTVTAGETIGIVGPSGSGKTTLLNLLVRLYDPTSASVTFTRKSRSSRKSLFCSPRRCVKISVAGARTQETTKCNPQPEPPAFTRRSSPCPRATTR